MSNIRPIAIVQTRKVSPTQAPPPPNLAGGSISVYHTMDRFSKPATITTGVHTSEIRSMEGKLTTGISSDPGVDTVEETAAAWQTWAQGAQAENAKLRQLLKQRDDFIIYCKQEIEATKGQLKIQTDTENKDNVDKLKLALTDAEGVIKQQHHTILTKFEIIRNMETDINALRVRSEELQTQVSDYKKYISTYHSSYSDELTTLRKQLKITEMSLETAEKRVQYHESRAEDSHLNSENVATMKIQFEQTKTELLLAKEAQKNAEMHAQQALEKSAHSEMHVDMLVAWLSDSVSSESGDSVSQTNEQTPVDVSSNDRPHTAVSELRINSMVIGFEKVHDRIITHTKLLHSSRRELQDWVRHQILNAEVREVPTTLLIEQKRLITEIAAAIGSLLEVRRTS